jgi:hypothetical protein
MTWIFRAKLPIVGAMSPRQHSGPCVFVALLASLSACAHAPPPPPTVATPPPTLASPPPRVDTDGDGVFDDADMCPLVAQGPTGDAAHPGCPSPDRDNDTVLDAVDACPDVRGVPSDDPSRSGCPFIRESAMIRPSLELGLGTGMVLDGPRVRFEPPIVFVRQRLAASSLERLAAFAEVLRMRPEIRRVSVEAHCFTERDARANQRLSDQRSRTVVQFLQGRGVPPARMVPVGRGDTQPLLPGNSDAARAGNTRLEILLEDRH